MTLGAIREQVQSWVKNVDTQWCYEQAGKAMMWRSCCGCPDLLNFGMAVFVGLAASMASSPGLAIAGVSLLGVRAGGQLANCLVTCCCSRKVKSLEQAFAYSSSDYRTQPPVHRDGDGSYVEDGSGAVFHPSAF